MSRSPLLRALIPSPSRRDTFWHEEATERLVQLYITISEGALVRVTELTLQVLDQSTLTPALQALRPSLSLQKGVIFTEEHYRQTDPWAGPL